MKVTATHMKRIHMGFTIFWLILAGPSIYFWGNSVIWVNILSLYAIIMAHVTAYQGARAERQGEKNNDPNPNTTEIHE